MLSIVIQSKSTPVGIVSLATTINAPKEKILDNGRPAWQSSYYDSLHLITIHHTRTIVGRSLSDDSILNTSIFFPRTSECFLLFRHFSRATLVRLLAIYNDNNFTVTEKISRNGRVNPNRAISYFFFKLGLQEQQCLLLKYQQAEYSPTTYLPTSH